MIGMTELKIDLATFSSLNAHKSSIDPPPLQIIITSNGLWFKLLNLRFKQDKLMYKINI